MGKNISEDLNLKIRNTLMGNTLTCKGWVQETALRMLLNTLDPDVAERPEDLIGYGGIGKAARNKEGLVLIIKALQRLIDRNITPDTLKDQTSAHDPLIRYFPEGLTVEETNDLSVIDPEEYTKHSYATIAKHVQQMMDLQSRGAIIFDYGNSLRGSALEAEVKNAFDFPRFIPAYIQPLFCEGKALSVRQP